MEGRWEEEERMINKTLTWQVTATVKAKERAGNFIERARTRNRLGWSTSRHTTEEQGLGLSQLG